MGNPCAYQRSFVAAIAILVTGVTSPALAQSPGGVGANLQLWLKADNAGAAVGANTTAWPDNSPNGRPVSAVGTMRVQAPDAAHNFYPYFTNFSSTSYFNDQQAVVGTAASQTSGSQVPQNIAVFAAVRPSSNSGTGRIVGLDNDDILAGEPAFSLNAGRVSLYKFSAGAQEYFHTSTVVAGQNTVMAWLAGTSASYGGLTMSLNGSPQSFALTGIGTVGQKLMVGYGTWSSAGAFPGDMQEVIWYNTGTGTLTTQQVQQIESYLAIKYGSTLAHNYLSGTGTTIYDVSSFSASVTGIGRDDASGLQQKQSRSTNAGAFVTIANGSGLAASNAANTNTFTADQSYELIGDNGLSATYSTAYVPNSFTPVASFAIMNRVWKVQETGTVGTVTVAIPGSQRGTYLLVSNTNSFSTGSVGVTEYALLPDGNGNVVATVDFTDGQFFTFGQDIIAPGCVTAGLDFWFDPAVGVTRSGTIVTGWADRDGSGNNPVLTQALTTLQPYYWDGDAQSNYNPYVNFQSNRRLSQAVTGSSYAIGHTTFGVVNNYTTKSDYTHFIRFANADNSDAGAHNWGLGHANDNTDKVAIHYINAPFSGGTGGNAFNKYNLNRSIVIGQSLLYGAMVDPTTPAATSVAVSHNGNESVWVGTATTSSLVPNNFLTIGGGSTWGMNDNKTSEIIHYARPLTLPERQRVNSYLAIRHGLTLDHNYLAGDGTVLYAVSSYPANVMAVGRDDCQGLLQKQSRSVSSTRMTISMASTVAATNATNPGSFTTDKTFIVIGDNGATGTSSFSSVTATSCPPPASTDKYTNLAYKLTETGAASALLVQEDLTGFGFNLNYPVYMQVYADAGFTDLLASVPMSYTNGTGTALYNFPANSMSYIRFAGNTTAPANLCVAPKAQTFHWNTWGYGDKQKVLLPNYTPASQSATAAITMSVTVTDPGQSLLYRPSVDWWPVFDGYGLFIPRNDDVSTQNNVITTRMQFRQGTSTSAVAANTVDFLIWDVDGWIGSRDLVKVYGRQGGNIITPNLSQYKPTPSDALQLNYLGDPQQALGSSIPWDGGAWAYLYVNFNQPVEEVWVEYTQRNTYSFKVYNDLRIGPVTATCAPPVPKAPLEDNVYVYKEVSPNPQKTGVAATYKFTVQNAACVTKTISLTDNLPSGLVWKDSSFVYSTSLTVGTVNAYGNGGSLQVGAMTVPPGTHYLYATVTGPTAGVYSNQASYVVTSGTGATLLSDDPSVAGTSAQPTPLTLIQNDPDANLSVQKTVDKATTAQNGVLTYTYTISNPNAGSAVLATFEDLLPGEVTYVAGTLTGIGSASASAYGGASVITIRNLNIPAASSLTLTVQSNVNSYTVGAVVNNTARVTPDLLSGFQIKTYASNVASTTVLGAPTVAILSPLASTTTTNTNLPISGTATPGAAVTVTAANGQSCLATADAATGAWSCTSLTFTPGSQTVTALASNAAGLSAPAEVSFIVTNATLAAGTIDCSKTQLWPAPVPGVPGQLGLLVTIDVTTPGAFSPLIVSGSGLSLANGLTSVMATNTGLQSILLPIRYDGSAPGGLSFTVGSAGSCTADLTVPSRQVITNVWTLDCLPTQGPGLK